MLGAQRANNPKCQECGKTVYPMERLAALDTVFHKGCFKCEICKTTLSVSNFKASSVSGKLRPYCNAHIPKEKGTVIVDSLAVKSALNAPKLRAAPGIQRDKRTTFGQGDLPLPDFITGSNRGSVDSTAAWTPAETPTTQRSFRITSASSQEVASQEAQVTQETQTTQVQEVTEALEVTKISTAPEVSQMQETTRVTEVESKVTVVLEPESKPIVVPSPIHHDTRPLEERLNAFLKLIPYLNEEDSELTVFWNLWKASIPLSSPISLQLTVSADIQQLHLEAIGVKESFLQQTPKFFTDVGAPDTEIKLLHSRLAETGSSLLGSWIDISASNGMDGGWKINGEIDVELALKGVEGEAVEGIKEWAKKHTPTVIGIGRDVGESLPRPAVVNFHLNGQSGREKCLDAWSRFGFESIPENVLNYFGSASDWFLSVTYLSKAFVKISIRVSLESESQLSSICKAQNVDESELVSLARTLGFEAPRFVEFQHLREGFGYDVYKEGFSLNFVYNI